MGHESLVDEQVEAGEVFVRDFSQYVSVDAAFWLNSADSGDWYLYVASSEVDDNTIRAAYGEVLRRVGVNRSQWLDAFQVKLLSVSDPLAAKVIEIRDFYSLKSPMYYEGSSIAGKPIEGACIYPHRATSSSTP